MNSLTRNFNGAGIGLIQRTHNLQQGGLACATRAYYADHLAGIDVEVDAFKHFELAKRFADVSQRYDRGGSASGRFRSLFHKEDGKKIFLLRGKTAM